MSTQILSILHLWETVGLNFCFIAAVFYPLEKLSPSKAGQKFFRPGWATDSLYFIAQHVFLEGVILSLFVYLIGSFWIGYWPDHLHQICARQPFVLQAVEVIVSGDFLAYWYHRAMHGNRWLWPIHAVHHSAEEMDWLATHREHPIDLMMNSFMVTFPYVVLGFPTSTLVSLMMFRGVWGLYLHSNTTLSPWIFRLLVGSPELHRWHHSTTRYACNFSNFSPWMDVLFGTYYCPNETPEAYGIQEPLAKDYLSQQFHPILAWYRLIKKTQAPPIEPINSGDNDIHRHDSRHHGNGLLANSNARQY